MKNYLTRLFETKNVVNDDRGTSALEVPLSLFDQGYIPQCGDALYFYIRLTIQGPGPG
jgi:hypothetical protein